ncbi:hypothetical protein [Roseobacter sinensis]|uniref:PEP-CTERM protein-sorting domain-containing protein n=1 Tax=Roseobacter sinensis TaxID=2931391 RepID=A0ABT3BA70_9RHOB|nr:hypothetical protein [Roseobacter sp. WL0113]MCV3270477.1 hypothetical protein [Roseobacter sp. WL0113]
MKCRLKAAMIAAALLAFAGPLPAKTISFSAVLESENYDGQPNPFPEQPARLDVVIEIDESVPPVSQQDEPDNGSSSNHANAITSLSYEAIGVGGGSLGLWSADVAWFGISDLPSLNRDQVIVYANPIGGPAPLDTLLIGFQGESSIFSGSDLGVISDSTLGSMTTGFLQLLSDVENGGMNLAYSIDFATLDVTGGSPGAPDGPAAIPLPASAILLLFAFAMLCGLRRSPASSALAPMGHLGYRRGVEAAVTAV